MVETSAETSTHSVTSFSQVLTTSADMSLQDLVEKYTPNRLKVGVVTVTLQA